MQPRFMMIRSILYSVLLMLGVVLAGCASTSSLPSADIQHVLAPTGSLRVALYTGTPTSVLSQTDLRGVGYELGKELARRLNVPFQPLIFPSNGDVHDALKSGRADVAFTNATAERAAYLDFTQQYLLIEMGFLATDKAPIAMLAEVDRQGVRVGVTANSTTVVTVSQYLKNAQVVQAATIATGIQMLSAGTLDAYATNKATLFEMTDKLPGSRVLDGSWGLERHALAVPKGRDRGLPYAQAFIADAIATGVVKAAITRAGLRGAVVADAKP